MNKSIHIIFEDKDYTLEFTRSSIQHMERNGFVADEIMTKPVTTLPVMFRGAFLSKHRYMKQEVIDRIFDKITNKQELIGKLAELYNDPILAMMEEPEESEGNAMWEANF